VYVQYVIVNSYKWLKKLQFVGLHNADGDMQKSLYEKHENSKKTWKDDISPSSRRLNVKMNNAPFTIFTVFCVLLGACRR